jgi:hypothetical protein
MTTHHLPPTLRMSTLRLRTDCSAWIRSTDGLYAGRTTGACFSPGFTYTEHGSIYEHLSWRMTQTVGAIPVRCHVAATNEMCVTGNRQGWNVGSSIQTSSNFIHENRDCCWSQNWDPSRYNPIEPALAAKERH